MIESVDLLVQIGILGTLLDSVRRTWRNERRLDSLLAALGIDPEQPAEYDVEAGAVPDGGERRAD